VSAIDILAMNAVSATILAAAVALARLKIRRPTVLHALWLAVLVDLLAPPVLAIRVLPSPTVVPASPSAIASDAPTGVASVSRAGSLRTAAAIVWGTGSLVVLTIATVRAARLSSVLRRKRLPSGSLAGRFAALSARAGIARAPRLRVVAARISPLVVPRLGGSEIVIPRGLVARLAPAELDAILVHELAHVRRGDPWIRFVELAAAIVFWWHPVVLVVRAALRRAEEQCCDAQVLRALPDHAVDYARALVKTIEFLSCVPRRVPVWTTGVAPVKSIERRLTMILDHEAPRRLSAAARIGLVLTLGVALAIFPAFRSVAEEDAAEPRSIPERDATLGGEAAEIERLLEGLALERAALERELEDLARARAVLDPSSEDGTDVIRARTKNEARARDERLRERVERDHERAREAMLRAMELDQEQLQQEIEREVTRARGSADAQAGRAHERAREAMLGAIELDQEQLQQEIERELTRARGSADSQAELETRDRERAERAGSTAQVNEALRREVERLARRVAELEHRLGLGTIE